MTRVVVVWEDRYSAKLDLCVRRALRHLGLTTPALFFDKVLGYGGFGSYVVRSWPVAVRHGFPKSGGPIDHLVCVADADRAHECCDVDNPATIGGVTVAWIEGANDRWTRKLREVASVAPDRVHGRFLRWNQESLLVAAHDVDQALTALGCRDRARIEKHLRACSPSPLAIADSDFVDAFRRPERCFEEMLKAAGASVPKKGAPPRGDAIEAASQHAMAKLCARVPDLAGLAQLVSALPRA
jgi:hypothetical protein